MYAKVHQNVTIYLNSYRTNDIEVRNQRHYPKQGTIFAPESKNQARNLSGELINNVKMIVWCNCILNYLF